MSILIIDVNGYKSSNDNVFYAREMAWAVIKKDEVDAKSLPTYWGQTYYCDNPNLPMPSLILADPMVAYLRECLHGLPLHPLASSFGSCRWSSQLMDEMRSIYEIALVIAKANNSALSLATIASSESALAISSAIGFGHNMPSQVATLASQAVQPAQTLQAALASQAAQATLAAQTVQTAQAVQPALVTIIHCGRTPGLTTLELFESAIIGLPEPKEKLTIPPLGRGVPPCRYHGLGMMKNSARCSINEVIKRIGAPHNSRMVQIDALSPSIMAPGINIFSSAQ